MLDRDERPNPRGVELFPCDSHRCDFLIGGVLSAMLEDRKADDAARILFLSGVAIMGAVAVYGFWKPRFVLNHLPTARSVVNPLGDVRSSIDHWPVYPALLIWLL